MTQTGMVSTEQVLAVGQKLLELRPLGEVLEAVIHAAAETMHAETAMILLRDGDKLQTVAQRHRANETERKIEDISSSLLAEAFQKGQPVLTENAVEDPRFSGKSSIILQHIQAAVIVPLATKEGIIGAIYLDSRSDRGQFNSQNLAPLATLATLSSLAIENARRYESARKEIQKLKAGKDSMTQFGLLIGASPLMKELYGLIERVSQSELPVMITGESGTGKELIARQVHFAGSRSEKPFLALYCGNVAPQLFESELFGHKKGSFTGAVSDKTGLVQEAAGGTLFLDEVADIPVDMQTKLLRFLQEGEFRAVGDTRTQTANVRIIAATNKNLQAEIATNRFRSDLYYRLFILPVHAPPLRDRSSDIPFLVKHFLDKYSPTKARGISPEALRKLAAYSWPGNVRELENTVARSLVVAQSERIEAADILLPDSGQEKQDEHSWKTAEQKHILHVLSICNGNKSRAAEALGISRRYLHYKLKEWGEEI